MFWKAKTGLEPCFFLLIYLMARKILMGDKGPWVKNIDPLILQITAHC